MQEITMQKLTQKYVQSLFEYHDGELYWKIDINNKTKIGNKAGSLQNHGYYSVGINYKQYYIHRLIFLYHHNYLPKYIDHIDNDKTNNKIENLREVTMSQNIMNSKFNKNSSSIYKGVSWYKSYQKWRSRIKINGKDKHLGYFINETEAAIAYNKAAIKYFGEFAYLNEV